jgi:hypothetical protein
MKSCVQLFIIIIITTPKERENMMNMKGAKTVWHMEEGERRERHTKKFYLHRARTQLVMNTELTLTCLVLAGIFLPSHFTRRVVGRQSLVKLNIYHFYRVSRLIFFLLRYVSFLPAHSLLRMLETD